VVKLVSMEWVAERLPQPQFSLLDPRRPMKYLSGHLPGAINIPVYKAFGTDGLLLSPELLARLIGDAGLGDDSAPIIYDSPEGQNGAMLAWTLNYLGHADVYLMEGFFEAWKAEGREVLYRPVKSAEKKFTAWPDPSVRATLDDLRDLRDVILVDFRSREEYSGSSSIGGDQPGHIPGAINIVWRELGNPPWQVLKPSSELSRMLESNGLESGGRFVAYCRSGPRAALGYVALSQLGADVRVFDGSFAQWSRAGLPIKK
jgi:thiosulfate/3-mercaptopyruvate sulfurtransferase